MKRFLILLLLACLLLAGCDQRTPIEKSMDNLFNDTDPELIERFNDAFNAGYYNLP